MSNTYKNSIAYWLLAVTVAVTFCGCEKSPVPEFRLNEVEVLKQEKASLDEGEHFPDSYRDEVQAVLLSLFGTPDDPKFPYLEGEDDEAHEFISFDDLKWAAGRVHSDERAGRSAACTASIVLTATELPAAVPGQRRGSLTLIHVTFASRSSSSSRRSCVARRPTMTCTVSFAREFPERRCLLSERSLTKRSWRWRTM